MSIQTFLLYLTTWSLVALTPGPAVMCSMALSTRYGYRSSLAGILGIQIGNLLFFICIALGLSTLLATATVAFTMLRTAGAAYLLYLGIRIILSTFGQPAQERDQPAVPTRTNSSLFLQGLLIQLTNPKALLFMSALLPQFIQTHRPLSLQLTVLALTTVAVDTTVLSSYAFLAQRGARSFRRSRLSAWLERVFGAVLVFFGVRLLVSNK